MSDFFPQPKPQKPTKASKGLKRTQMKPTPPKAQPDMVGAFYGFVKAKPCIQCGHNEVEVAHIRAAVSLKTGLDMPRRKSLNRVMVLPLCKEHHTESKASIHQLGEKQFEVYMGRGEGYLFRYAASLIAEFCFGELR